LEAFAIINRMTEDNVDLESGRVFTIELGEQSRGSRMLVMQMWRPPDQ
jgi:hypothetical protein